MKTGNLVVGILMVLNLAITFTLISFTPDEVPVHFDMSGEITIVVILGVLLLALGNVMPKANSTAVFGVQTSWSMSSEDVWQKTQRFGGYASIVAGLVMIVWVLPVTVCGTCLAPLTTAQTVVQRLEAAAVVAPGGTVSAAAELCSHCALLWPLRLCRSYIPVIPLCFLVHCI